MRRLPVVAAREGVEVLIVEDDVMLGEQLAHRLTTLGYRTTLRRDPAEVLTQLARGADWDVVLLDIGLPNISGIDVLREFGERKSLASVIMLTGDDSASTATRCMRGGAFYYLTKPFEPLRLASLVTSAARYTLLRRQLAKTVDEANRHFIGINPRSATLRSWIDRVAAQDVSVLVEGESGTGKELVAQLLHERGRRAREPFVALNCGAIPHSLIDSELFGHVKGAFTGATTDRAGVFAEADGGTLFLDEIGDMSIDLQARLLRVLQEGEVRALGSNQVQKVDVRVIAATNVDLGQAVAAGRFRDDLYYRLNVVGVSVPPLRDRLDDVPLLAAHFLRKHGGPSPPALSVGALEKLTEYLWPGNVRELENAILHAIALGPSGEIRPESLPSHVVRRTPPAVPTVVEETLPLVAAKRRAIAEYERQYLLRTMERARGSVSDAARRAGLDRANFRRLLTRHNIDPMSFK